MSHLPQRVIGVNIIIVFLLIFSMPSFSQRMWSEQSELSLQLRNSKADKGRIHLLLRLSKLYLLRENYLYNSNFPNAHLDSAIIFAEKALDLSKVLKDDIGKDEALLLKGDALIRKHEIKPALTLYWALQKTGKFRLLIILSRNYLFHQKRTKSDLDSALFFLEKAYRIPMEQINAEWRPERLHVSAMRSFITNGLQPSVKIYREFIKHISSPGNEDREALVWHELSTLVPTARNSGLTQFYCFEKMLALYTKINHQERQAWVLKCLGDIYLVNGKLDLAESRYLDALKIYQYIGYRNLHYIYDLLAVTRRNKGDFRKCKYYALKAIASMQATNDSVTAHTFYKQLANLYRQSGQPDRSVEWYTRTLNNKLYKDGNNVYLFYNADFFARELVKVKKEKEALNYILNIKDHNKPNDIHATACLISSLAYCYQAVNDHQAAEKYYQRLINIAGQLQKDNELTSDIYCRIGQYYIDKKQFKSASGSLQNALEISEKTRSRSKIKDIQLMLFNVDHGMGKYSSAIRHLLRYQLLNDSLFNETKSWQIEELKIQFETKKKDNDIRLLNSQNKLQRILAEEANRTKNITLIILVFSFIIVALLFNRNLTKQKNNRQLKSNQKELDQKNDFLETLNLDQEKLIREKEWLLKELHHRVKNNLQMVTSLLYSQSMYLQDATAKLAITDSLRRMQSMSLIHKKLYLHENSSTIAMPEYISDLVKYLHDSFDDGDRITFNQLIAPIELDVSRAIPLGLIITESIVNAIKYAFKNGDKGLITTSLKKDGAEHLLLLISDNGIGLPEGLDIMKPRTLGLDLMQGLAKQLKGEFHISSTNGVHISVRFAM